MAMLDELHRLLLFGIYLLRCWDGSLLVERQMCLIRPRMKELKFLPDVSFYPRIQQEQVSLSVEDVEEVVRLLYFWKARENV